MRLLRRSGGKPDAFWCDALVEGANAGRMRSLEIAAPPKLVFRWLCQLRVASYSYEWADSSRRRSPRELMPGLDELELGQTLLGVYELAHFVPGRELTVRLDPGRMADQRLGAWFAPTAATYRVSASGSSSTRLVAKSVTAFPPGARWRLVRVAARVADELILRRQLRALKRLAERDHARERGRRAPVEDLALPVVTLAPRKRESIAS